MVAAEEMINQLNQTSWWPGRTGTRFPVERSDVGASLVLACSKPDHIILGPDRTQLSLGLIFKVIGDVCAALKQNWLNDMTQASAIACKHASFVPGGLATMWKISPVCTWQRRPEFLPTNMWWGTKGAGRPPGDDSAEEAGEFHSDGPESLGPRCEMPLILSKQSEKTKAFYWKTVSPKQTAESVAA